MFHWMEASTLHKTSIQNVGGIHAAKLKCRSIQCKARSHILVKKKEEEELHALIDSWSFLINSTVLIQYALIFSVIKHCISVKN